MSKIQITPKGPPISAPYSAWTVPVELVHKDDLPIYYTLDGSTPTVNSLEYRRPLTIGGENIGEHTCMVCLRYSDLSDEGCVEVFTFSRPESIWASHLPGCYPLDEEIALYASGECVIFYTLDGSCPLDSLGQATQTAVRYTEPIQMGDFTLTAVAVNYRKGKFSKLLSYVYFEEEPLLEIAASHLEKIYKEPIAVRLTSSDPEAMIRYTLDGASPLSYLAPTYDSPIILGNCESSVELRAVAVTPEGTSEELHLNYTFKD